MLSAMQVELAAEVLSIGKWEPYRYVCRRFSVLVIAVSALVGKSLALLLAAMVGG